MKKTLIGLTAMLLAGMVGTADATTISFSNTINFGATGTWNGADYTTVTDDMNYTHIISLSDFDPDQTTFAGLTIYSARLELRHAKNSANTSEAWFTSTFNGGTETTIGTLSESNNQWVTQRWDLSADVMNLMMTTGTPWDLTIRLHDNTSGADKLRIDYSTLSGLVSSEPVPEPVPEPATMLLLGTGLVGLVGAKRRKKA